MAGSMVYRPRAGAIGDPGIVIFRDAMSKLQAISDNRGYNHIGGFHGAPGYFCWHHQRRSGVPLQARLFLPWHRAYLWWLEQALQDQVEGTALPWWDWTINAEIPDSYASPEVEGEPNPLYNFHVRVPNANPPIDRMTERNPGASPFGRLPTKAQIDDLLEDSDWASFSDRLQEYHDRVHVWVGGDMARVATAGFDPIFFAHHCMVDRVWYLWQVRHGSGGIPGSLLDLALQPFGKTVRDTLDVQSLGYEYATSATEIDINQ